MRRILILALLLWVGGVTGQTKKGATKKATITKGTTSKSAKKSYTSPKAGGGYTYPLLKVAGLYSANFGEMRPRHFHAGIDIKTEGVVGKPLVSIGDGVISRATVSAGGYGRALYVILNDGRTAVYGHIDRFRDDIEQIIDTKRRESQSNTADISFTVNQLPVRQGDLIAYAGNSGSSFGPHLHFELRDTSGSSLNCVRMGIFKPKDNIPPIIMQLHYFQLDTINGVAIHTPMRSYHAALIGGGRYRLLHEGAVEISEKGYWVVETSDRRNGVNNRFGIYRASLKCDSTTIFEYRIDQIRSGDARGCDAVSHYPIQISSNNEAIRLAKIDQAPKYLYPTLVQRGVVYSNVGQKIATTIQIEDDCANISTLRFETLGVAQSTIEAPDSSATILHPSRSATLRVDECMSAYIPQWGLHEAIFCHPLKRGATPASEGLVVLTPTYMILDSKIPLRKNMTISMRAEVPIKLQSRSALAACNFKGGFSFIGGTYADGVLTARTSTTGDVVMVADTLPPTIHPQFSHGADLTARTVLRFKVNDNFSGIAHYSLRIDGEWRPCERFPMKNTLEYPISSIKERKTHTVEISVRDGCGNSTHWKGTFYR